MDRDEAEEARPRAAPDDELLVVEAGEVAVDAAGI
jgi:hypothetical protein